MAEEEIQLTEQEIALAQEPIDGQGEPIADAQEAPADAEPVEEEVSEPVAEDEQEEVQEEVASESGLSDEDYNLGESYGLTKEEVDDLGSRDLLEKFGKISARQMLDSKPAEEKESKDEPVAETDESDKAPAWDLSKIDLDEYDDVTRSAFGAIDNLQKEIQGLKEQNQRLQSTQEDSALQDFGVQLDSLDPDFFGVQYTKGGKPKKLDKEQMDRRMKLAEAVDVMTAGYSSQGRPLPDLETLVKDANAITFRDRVEEVHKKNASQKLKKQAARRQTSGSRVRKPTKQQPLDDEEAEIQRILAETDDIYHRMLEEN